ncbi:MAG TPA: alpha/beta hydrolase, partial [Nostoc sp.]|uniref:alpha/beta hydrolase n=1 Tax=Nostoc sp. TaxID=1180 RepID=UPI002D358969
TAAPILLTNTRFDPATSFFSANQAQNNLGNAHLLTVDGYGHISYARNSCATAHTDRYLLGGTMPTKGTVCAAEFEPFPVQTPDPSATPTDEAEGLGAKAPLTSLGD